MNKNTCKHGSYSNSCEILCDLEEDGFCRAGVGENSIYQSSCIGFERKEKHNDNMAR